MVHLVYFSPGNLGDRVVQTEAGPAALISCLRSLLQNCLLLDFKDYRFDEEVSSEADKLPDHVRKPVKTLLAQLVKRNRIVRAAEDDYSGKAPLDLLAAQAEKLGLELVIVQVNEPWDEAASGVPHASIVTYAMSDFEERRSQDMATRHLENDAMAGRQFIDLFLVPFVRYAEQLAIVDGSLGENYRDDYSFTLERFLAAVTVSCHWKDRVRVTVHCCRGPGRKPENVQDTLIDLARKYGLAGRVEVQFYGQPGQPYRFKHDRCLVSEIGVVNIGRGFDFIHKPTGLLRETTIGFGGPDLDTMLAPYAAARS